MTDTPTPTEPEPDEGPEDDTTEWPDPRPEPEDPPADHHQGPLDDDEDGRWLEVGDPRRTAAERRLGRRFSDA